MNAPRNPARIANLENAPKTRSDRAALDEALRAIEASTNEQEANDALTRWLRIARRVRGEE